MTKREAIEQMHKGMKITHRYFSPDEWMTMRSDGMMVLEDGVICTPEDIWRWRTSIDWDDGYSLFIMQ